ncbi:MAG: uracil-DNA glycosylase [Bacteroidales bacterium]|jgi:uracil-DNA glycosylase|nr:uracil-DNA glycosylase [Bacteroidales bacterium]
MSEQVKIEPKINHKWLIQLKKEFESPYFADLKNFLLQEKKEHQIFPPGNLIFNAFELTPFDEVKVVLLGQDPYHNFHQAHGLCFSVPDDVALPKSLINIFKELSTDLNIDPPCSGNLEFWAKQGVFLLNAILTVRAHEASSHQNKGWETFTDAVIRSISDNKENVVFLLWGNYAQAKKPLIDANKHCILTAPHPSPLSASRGFFGCRHFSKTNQYLRQTGQTEIRWTRE